MTGQASGSSRAWFCYVVAALMICSADTPLWAQRSSARYVGNTLEGPRITMYKCKPPKGTLDASSDRDLVFDDGKNRLVTLGYNKISSLKYGLEAGTGHFCFPWDSYVQFTKKRHSLLTIASVDPSGQELHLVFELDRAAVRPMLARLETLSDKRVEFTDAVACTDYKTAEECGYGQPFELKGLTKVFIGGRPGPHRSRDLRSAVGPHGSGRGARGRHPAEVQRGPGRRVWRGVCGQRWETDGRGAR
jgi:hypothetical protein